MNNSLFLRRAAKSFSSHLVLFIFLYGFIVKSFLLCFSFQSQHSHLVMQQLLGHLDANSKNSATVRAGIVEVLLEAAAIAASGSVGKLSISTHACIFLYLFYTVKWILIIRSCRSHSFGGLQHPAATATSERWLRVDRLVRWKHQHRH